MDRPRVVLVGLDGFPLRHVSRAITPVLWRLAGDPRRSMPFGIAGLPATTYPGFASLLTGVDPGVHGVWVTGPRPHGPDWARVQRVRVETLLDEARRAGLHSAAVLGDHLLADVLAVSADSLRWPPGGRPSPQAKLDEHGYPVNAEVLPFVLSAAADPELDLLFAHLNETDTIGHDRGPAASETAACAADTDAMLGEIVSTLTPDWHRTVLCIVSDHDMEARSDLPPVPLAAAGELVAGWVADGGGAVLLPLPGAGGIVVSRLLATPGVAEATLHRSGMVVAGAEPGRGFEGTPTRPYRGVHGGPSTARTLAIVAGGHPAVHELRRWVAGGRPALTDWAGPLRRLLRPYPA